MKKATLTRVIAMLLVVMMTFTALPIVSFASKDYQDSVDTGSTGASSFSSSSYEAYLYNYAVLFGMTDVTAAVNANKPAKGTTVTVYDASNASFNANYVFSDTTGIYDSRLSGTQGFTAEKLAALQKIKTVTGKDFLFLPENGTVTFDLNVASAGFYGIRIEYYPFAIDGKISSPEKKLTIDGELPFSECTALNFVKNWSYKYNYVENSEGNFVFIEDAAGLESFDGKKGSFVLAAVAAQNGLTAYGAKRFVRSFEQDINGNDLKADVEQDPYWMTYTVQDANGFIFGDLEFYFTEGEHTLSLSGVREGLAIKSITLFVTENGKTYAEYHDSIKDKPCDPEKGEIVMLEAEAPDAVSDSSVYPANDRSSAITSPSNPMSQLLNVIGKTGFSTSGQWASYTFTVTKTGLYKFAVRYKQTALEGMFASRVLKLWSSDGDFGNGNSATAPFEEAYRMRFNYKDGWQTNYFGYYDAQNEFNAFEFYFKEGVEYRLVFEVGLGDMAEIINTVQNSLTEINEAYLNIIKLTGTTPDEYRSYNFKRVMPHTVKTLANNAVTLQNVVDNLKNITGVSGSHTATLITIQMLLEKMGKYEDEIAPGLGDLKSYIGNLGTWLNTAKQQSIIVDYISVQPSSVEELPYADANFFQAAWFELSAFVSSFFMDYNAMGITEEMQQEGTVDVWLAYGRDQSQIWRSLVDDQFTSEEGIAVTLKLVPAGTLLPSVLCGQGPDVYIGLAATDTINYAIRNAVLPIQTVAAQEDIDVIAQNFADSALVPISLHDMKTGTPLTYGLPETSNFNMMFLRNDVLEELGIGVPETWDDVLAAVPILQANNMQAGVSYAATFNMFLYQRGGGLWLYNGTNGYAFDKEYAGAQIGFGTNLSLEAFGDLCRLFTDYSFPVSYDAANRIRTGEMPILIAEYVATYNQLIVFATEIAGLWSFTQVPGTVVTVYDEQGNVKYDNEGNVVTEICHDTMTSVTATVLLYSDDRTEDQAGHAWKFMKWQCGDKAQAAFGNQMVALIGPSAKYASANMKAIENLSWTSAELAAIKQQLQSVSAIENYPGAYIISRYVQFAFYDAYNEKVDPAVAMQAYVNVINKEITRKREEFGWSTLKIGQTPEEARAEAQK